MKFKNISIIIIFFLLINITIFKIYWVPSDSMENTIKSGDFTYVYQLPYLLNYGEPKYDDILVFAYPLEEKYNYVKRLIGKPEDIILISENKLYRNGTEVVEEYINNSYVMEDYGPVTVPEYSYFFMGDNRERSIDSREWGFVDYSLIKGKVISVIWPLERAGEVR